MKKTYAIRGATTIKCDTKTEIEQSSIELLNQILIKNNIEYGDIAYIQISSTADILSYYPATALRLNGCKVPLFSSLEPPINDSLPLCIRLLVVANLSEGFVPVHVYLRDAKNLILDIRQ